MMIVECSGSVEMKGYMYLSTYLFILVRFTFSLSTFPFDWVRRKVLVLLPLDTKAELISDLLVYHLICVKLVLVGYEPENYLELNYLDNYTEDTNDAFM
jgi:hypothetical protein